MKELFVALLLIAAVIGFHVWLRNDCKSKTCPAGMSPQIIYSTCICGVKPE